MVLRLYKPGQAPSKCICLRTTCSTGDHKEEQQDSVLSAAVTQENAKAIAYRFYLIL